MTSSTASQFDVITAIIDARKSMPGALLPILHEIQDSIGYIPGDAVPLIATALNFSRAEIYGVVTFYHHFRTTPPAKHTIHICCAEACQSMGAQQLVRHAEKSLAHVGSRACELHAIYCLGLCATSPAMMIDDELHARVTPEKFDKLIKQIASGK
jgi:formate dehydrogenase subunit gamma